MLDQSPEALWAEIEYAEEVRDKHLFMLEDMLEGYGGPAYKSDRDSGADQPENHAYEFIRITTGQIVHNNPRWRVKTRRPSVQRIFAVAVQHALNRLAKDEDLVTILRDVYAMGCFAWCPVVIASEPVDHLKREDGSPVHWPRASILEPDDFFFDPLARRFDYSRYFGHRYRIDKDDLLDRVEKEEGWKREAIDRISTFTMEDMDEDQGAVGVDRKELVVREIWVREIETGDPDEGYHGTIFTLAQGGARGSDETFEAYIREPMPFYGPPKGPYLMYGVYPMPGSPYPLSPLTATYSQVKHLNEVSKAVIKKIREHKTLVFYPAEQPDIGEKVKDEGDAWVIPVRGLGKESQIVQYEVSGLTDQQLKHLVFMHDLSTRATGVTQTMRGEIAKETATAISLAQQSADENLEYMKRRFYQFVGDLGWRQAWYIWNDDRFEIGLDEEQMGPQAAQMGMELVVRGGANEMAGAFEDMEFDVDAKSMPLVNDALERAQFNETLMTVSKIAPLIPQTPWVNWGMLLSKGGDVFNDPDFANLINPQIAMQFAGLQGSPFGPQQQAPEFSGHSRMTRNQQQNSMPSSQSGLMGAQQRRIAP